MPVLTLRRFTAAALLAATFPVAASGIFSSISESVSTAVGSVSDSIKRSSDSSSNTVGLADGDYRITQVALIDDKPGMTKLTLQAADTKGAPSELVDLILPTPTVDRHALAQGDVITARHRAYGIEFASTNQQPFFLAVTDDVHRELGSYVVKL